MRHALGMVVLFASVIAAGALVARERASRPHFADADDPALVSAGERLYAANCASCHGANREGQPDWQHVGPDGRVRAPPHDETGHSWMHPDEQLFRFVKYSMADIAAPGYVSPMPSFDNKLSDKDILATIAFIKNRWPTGVRVFQAMLNPGDAGLPAGASSDGWLLPPDCGEQPTHDPADHLKPKPSP